MALGELENKILKLVDTKVIDIEKVRELFEKGANPNALEDDEPDKGFNNDIYYSTFFSECIFEAQDKAPNLYELLKIFIEYGLDIEKYGASIIGDFHFIFKSSDIYEMTKLMLNNAKNKIDVEEALTSIGIEESFRNCSLDEMPDRDETSNDLFGLYALLEAYKNEKEYNGIFRLNLKPNQKFIDFKVSGNFAQINENKIAVKSEKEKCCMISKIQVENDSLIIEDNYGVYINNNDINEYVENEFTRKAKQYFANEKITEIKFRHYEVETNPTSHAHGRVVTVIFTNDKKLVYEEDIENKLKTIEIK